MKVFVLASAAIVALSTVQAHDMSSLHLRMHGNNAKHGGSVGIWEDCTAGNVGCDGGQCVYHSQYYAQCKPFELPQGELCGQADGTNQWWYDHCPSGQSCQQNGSDFRCA